MLPFARMVQYGNLAPVYENTGKYELQTLTDPIPLSRSGPALCSDGSFIYGYGGYGPAGTYGSTRTDLWRFDYSDNSFWTITSNLDGQRTSAGIAYYNNMLYFIGYEFNSGTTYGTFFTYNLSSGQKANILGDTGRPTAFADYEIIVNDNLFYVMHSASSTLYVYNVTSNTWSNSIVVGFNKASGKSKMCLLNGKMYIIGRLYNNFLVQYDLSTNSTVNMPVPPGVTNESTVRPFYVQAVMNELYAFVQSTVYKFNFNTNAWVLVNDTNNIIINKTSYINSPNPSDKASVYSFNDSGASDAASTRVYKII